MSDETDIAYDSCTAHIRGKHDEYGVPVSCGAGSYACPLCDWQVFVEISGGA